MEIFYLTKITEVQINDTINKYIMNMSEDYTCKIFKLLTEDVYRALIHGSKCSKIEINIKTLYFWLI